VDVETDTLSASRGRLPYPIQLVLLAAAYTAAGKLGLELAFANSSVSAVWAPTGIALTALLLGGYRLWPAVALGAVLTNIDTGVPPATVLGITAGNTLEALAGAYLLNRVGFKPNLRRVRDVFALVALGAGVSTAIAASIGVSSLLIGDEISWSGAGTAWRTWWLGDAGGDLIVAPLLLIALTYRPLNDSPGRWYEAVALAAAIGGVSTLVFTLSTDVVYPVFPLLIWAALRFWQPGAAASSFLVAGIAVGLTAGDHGPFADTGPDDRLLLAQTFVATAGVTTLVLAAMTRERSQAERAQRELAATLQQSLMPRALPHVPSIEGAAFFRAAGERHLVGGDFYDLFEIAEGRWAVAVGDVVGKGAPAAALTAMARHTLRAAGLREGQPSRVLQSLNDAVRRQRQDKGALCTAAYATLDVNGSSVGVTMSNAGHPVPIVLRSDGRVEPFGGPGTLLGVKPPLVLADHHAELARGDALVFYTDGLTDAYAPERVVQTSEIEAILAATAGGGPEQIIEALERELLGAQDREPRDDIAIVVLRVSG
jgi:integral membrane sensor domain MASE1